MFTPVLSSAAEIEYDKTGVLLRIERAADDLARYILALRGYDILVGNGVDPSEISPTRLQEAHKNIDPDKQQHVVNVAHAWVTAALGETVGTAISLREVDSSRAPTLGALFGSGFSITNSPVPTLVRNKDPHYLTARLPSGSTQQDTADAHEVASRCTDLPREVSGVILKTVFDIAQTGQQIITPTRTLRHMLPRELRLPPGIDEESLGLFLRRASNGELEFTTIKQHNSYSYSLYLQSARDCFGVATSDEGEPYAIFSPPPIVRNFKDKDSADRHYRGMSNDPANPSQLVETEGNWSIVTHRATLVAQIKPSPSARTDIVTDIAASIHDIGGMQKQLQRGAKLLSASGQ